MKTERGRDKFSRFRPLLMIGVKVYSFFPQKYVIWKLNHIRDKRGLFYIALRWVLLNNIALAIGDNVAIHDHVFLYNADKMSFGNNVSIHPLCYLQGSGGISIGNDVSIAHGVTIMTENHNYKENDVPIKDQEVEKEKIEIEDNVWIGAKATILYGNKIAKGAVVAAGAIVTKDVQPNTVVGGIPAKIIMTR